MRPPSIVRFERVVLLSILIGIVSTFLTWDRVSTNVSTQAVSSNTVLVVQAITIALYLVLIWFISRHGSPVAKWIYVVLAGSGVVAGLAAMGEVLKLGTTSAVLGVIQLALTIYSIWLLFRPDANGWFSEGRGGADTHSAN